MARVEDAATGWGKRLVYKITCPNCWHVFLPEDCLFVAKHSELIGDPVLGGNEYRRFAPTHFTIRGEALDPRGFPTSELACPRCHMQIPEAMLEVPPVFISLIGTPASGKSYFLTTMIWELRRLLPQAKLMFADADTVANAPIHEYEKSLFLNPAPDVPTEIRKTQPDDPRLHRIVRLDGVDVRFPVPLQFTVWPTLGHPKFNSASQIGKIVVLYDNAGEDFRPSLESGQSAVLQHLARSKIFFVLFDPTQEPRLRSVCNSQDPQLTHGARPDGRQLSVLDRQELVLREAGMRVRRYLGLPPEKQLDRVMVVVVPKADVWKDAIGLTLDEEPYGKPNDGGPIGVRIDMVRRASDQVREFLQHHCPEFVASAEGLCKYVKYVPVSSLGGSPEVTSSGEHTYYGIRPKNIRPQWVTVPMMYCLCRFIPGLIGESRPRTEGHP